VTSSESKIRDADFADRDGRPDPQPDPDPGRDQRPVDRQLQPPAGPVPARRVRRTPPVTWRRVRTRRSSVDATRRTNVGRSAPRDVFPHVLRGPTACGVASQQAGAARNSPAGGLGNGTAGTPGQPGCPPVPFLVARSRSKSSAALRAPAYPRGARCRPSGAGNNGPPPNHRPHIPRTGPRRAVRRPRPPPAHNAAAVRRASTPQVPPLTPTDARPDATVRRAAGPERDRAALGEGGRAAGPGRRERTAATPRGLVRREAEPSREPIPVRHPRPRRHRRVEGDAARTRLPGTRDPWSPTDAGRPAALLPEAANCWGDEARRTRRGAGQTSSPGLSRD
jgi:hypothetical protein